MPSRDVPHRGLAISQDLGKRRVPQGRRCWIKMADEEGSNGDALPLPVGKEAGED